MLNSYDEFCKYVDRIGFLTLSENPVGWPSVSALTLEEQWFTDGDGDPWQWKTRIVEDRRAAYAKIFFCLPSFISREWYPRFLAVRRDGQAFEDAWETGLMSAEAKRIYHLFQGRSVLATHEIKRLGDFAGKSKGRYDSAMTALQVNMFLTVSGMTRMTTLDGRPHSWPVTEYRTVESWAWEEALEQAGKMSPREAEGLIAARIHEILPSLAKSSLQKFIGIQRALQ